jgi:hypothetical protein
MPLPGKRFTKTSPSGVLIAKTPTLTEDVALYQAKSLLKWECVKYHEQYEGSDA